MSNTFFIGDRDIGGHELSALIEKYAPLFTCHRRIILHSLHPLPIIIGMILSERHGISLYLCHAFFSQAQLAALAIEHKADCVITGDAEGTISYHEPQKSKADEQKAYLHIFTTGTTGQPKCVRHTWKTIGYASHHVSPRLQNRTWLMAYSFTGYAGLQVFFSAVRSGGNLVLVEENDFEKFAEAIIRHGVEVISATPTFWRLLVNGWPERLPYPKLTQATLGGEIVTQDVLDLLSERLQPERITHIYASSEAGSAIAVSDQKAGFPVAFLDQPRSVKLRVRDQILEIESPHRMQGYVGRASTITADGWIHTGDMVEQRGDRLYFVGRSDSQINIGGSKVRPEEVEEALNRFAEIEDSVVYAKQNPIVGSLLAADLVVTASRELTVTEIKNRPAKNLPEYKIPQFIRFVEQIRISENAKKCRA